MRRGPTLETVEARASRASIGALLLLLGISACTTGQLDPDATRKDAGPVAYTLVRHPTSDVEMPRISLPERPGVEAQVNAQLDSLAASLACENVEDGEYDTRAVVTYSATDVLSVHVVSSYYCGGPYPTNSADSSVTFDLSTGQAVPFRALFEDYARDAIGIARTYVENLSAEDLEGCEDVLTVEELDGHFFAYTISTQGLRVEPSFPHVLEACNRPSIIPFDELRPWAAPEGTLARVADAHAERS